MQENKPQNGTITKIYTNKANNITGIEVTCGSEKYYSHVGDLKIVEDLIYKARDIIQDSIHEGDKVTFFVFKNKKDGRATSVEIN